MGEKKRTTGRVGDRGPAQVRLAMICPKCNYRSFGNPKWTCPDHGVAVVQENAPYFGERTPTLDDAA